MAKNTFGTQIQLSATAISGAAGKLANCTKIGFPNPSVGTVDTTTHDNAGGVASYLADGIVRFKPMKVSLQITPGDATDVICNTAATSNAVYYVKITANGASATFTYTFQAIVTDYDVAEAPVNGVYEAELTLQPTGAVTRA